MQTLAYLRTWIDLVAGGKRECHGNFEPMRESVLRFHLERRLLAVVTMSGVAECTFGRSGFCLVGVRVDSLSCRKRKYWAFCFLLEKIDRFDDYVGIPRTLVGAATHDTKQISRRSQFCDLHSSQQRVEGCATWFTHGMKVQEGKKGLIKVLLFSSVLWALD